MCVFISIILMFQVLRLTDFALSHGVELLTIVKIISYVCISMLPALFPMSLLFSVLLTYGRLSQDSEIIAMKASGIHMSMILTPALVMGIIVSIISAQTSFKIAPWGNRQFEILFSTVGNTKAGASLKEGTFSEGFFNLVIYSNKVDSKNGLLEDVFIYDEKTDSTPLTIIARQGQIIPDPLRPGHRILLRLLDGNIHRKGTTHTKIKFDTYDINLIDPIKTEIFDKSHQSFTLDEIEEKTKTAPPQSEEFFSLTTEYHKRWAISVLCIIFALIGVGLGTTTNKRAIKASGFIISIGLIVLYWILYLSFEGVARSGKIPAAFAIWLPNFVFLSIAIYSLRKNWN